MNSHDIQRISITKIKSRQVALDIVPSHSTLDTLNLERFIIIIHRLNSHRFVVLLGSRLKVIVNCLLQDSNILNQSYLVNFITGENIL